MDFDILCQKSLATIVLTRAISVDDGVLDGRVSANRLPITLFHESGSHDGVPVWFGPLCVTEIGEPAA